MDEIKTLHEGRFLALVKNGAWEYVERRKIGGVVGIIAVTDDKEIVLIEQFNPVHQKVSVELPAGLVGDVVPKETLPAAAARELLEETGFKADRLEYVAKAATSAGLTNEVVHLYKTVGLKRTSAGGGVDDENIMVSVVPLSKVPSWLGSKIATGAIVDVKIFAALYFASVHK